jgi:phosphoserine phosphatase RsbU/P
VTARFEQVSSRAAGGQRYKVLVVDDSRAQRRLLRLSLDRWGYEVTEADSGESALALCAVEPFDIILSDWMMTGMSGLDFCRAFRAMPFDSYGYFILLTSKSEKDEVALGLDAGADDFLTKPVTPQELRARMQAGERLIGVQKELRDKNRLLATTLEELRKLYDSLDRDLIEARKIQQSLVRERHRDFGSASVSLMLRPSGHVGGDLVGYFLPDARHLSVYAVDVSGHGVAAAMLAARVAGMMGNSAPDGNICWPLGTFVGDRPRSPEAVAARLNHLMLDVMRIDQYLTLVFAQVDRVTGTVQMVQAGHPHPFVIATDGTVRRVGDGGLPVGLIEGADFSRVEFTLEPGERLFFMSDGLTECMNPEGQELGETGLTDIVARLHGLRGTAFLDALQWEIEGFANGTEIVDDVSAVVVDYFGPLAGDCAPKHL